MGFVSKKRGPYFRAPIRRVALWNPAIRQEKRSRKFATYPGQSVTSTVRLTGWAAFPALSESVYARVYTPWTHPFTSPAQCERSRGCCW